MTSEVLLAAGATTPPSGRRRSGPRCGQGAPDETFLGEGAGTDRWKELRRRWVPESSVAVRRREALTGRSHEWQDGHSGTKGTGATLRDGDQKLDGNETAACRSARDQ